MARKSAIGCGFGALVMVAWAAWLFAGFSARPSEPATLRLSRVKVLATAFWLYTADNDGLAPLERWATPVQKYIRGADGSDFPTKNVWPAFNKHLTSVRLGAWLSPRRW